MTAATLTVRRPLADPAVRRGAGHALPLCLALAPIGFLLGVTIAESSIDGVVGWAGGPLLAAGAGHFALLSLLDQGTGVVAAVATAVAIQARTVLYSAALAARFADQPRWFRWAGPYFLVDQLFVMVDEEHARDDDPTHVRRYYLTIGGLMAATWATVIAAGMVAGPVIPPSWRVELMVVVLVVAMLRPALTTRAARLAAGTAAAVAVAASVLPLGAGLLVGALAGMAAGGRAEADR